MTPENRLIESIQAAMQVELEAEALYKKIANAQEDAQVKAFFSKISKDEGHHYVYLKTLLEELTHGASEQLTAYEDLAEEPQHDIFSTEFLVKVVGAKDLEKALEAALLLEENAVRHYELLKDSTDSSSLKAFFSIMVKFEKKHYDTIKELKEKLIS